MMVPGLRGARLKNSYFKALVSPGRGIAFDFIASHTRK